MEKDKVNYGFIIAGISACVLGISELTKGSSNEDLKRQVCHSTSLDISNEGKLIYVSGMLYPNNKNSLQDDLFRVSVSGFKLRRKVDMYQWIGSEPSSMKLGWSKYPISSSKLPNNYANPKWKIHDLDYTAKGPFSLNNYKIGSEILNCLKSWKEIQGEYQGSDFKQAALQGRIILYSKKKKQFKIPKVGDYRIIHEYIPAGLYVSVIGKQKGEKIVPYKGKFFIAKEGCVPSDELIDEYTKKQTFRLWLIRLGCGVGITLGLATGLR
jgi:Transmembrane protein 43